METSQFYENVGAQLSLIGSLTIIGIIFFLGLLVNVCAVIISFRSRQARGFTDKFLLYVLVTDLVSLFVFLPLSFVFIFESYSHLNTIKENHHYNSAQEERPLFFGKENSPKRLGDVLESDERFSGCFHQWIFVIHKFFFITTANLSVLAAFKIAFERYLAVVTPLHYHKILKSSVIGLVSLISSLLSLSFAAFLAIEPNEFSAIFMCQCTSNFMRQSWSVSSEVQAISIRVPDSEWNEAGPVFNALPQHNLSQESQQFSSTMMWWPVLKLVHATVFFIVPVVAMIFIYTRIWTEARRQSARITQSVQSTSPYILPADVSKPDGVNIDGLQQIFSKFKLMQRFKRKPRMNKAARVGILAVGLVLSCFMPLYYVQISAAISYLQKLYGNVNQESTPQSVQQTSLLRCLVPLIFACLHPLLSPLVYVYRYKKVRNELKAILKQLISSTKCCTNDSTDCQNIVHQFNHIAKTLPNSTCVDAGQNMLESQSSSNADIETSSSVTVDLRCADRTEVGNLSSTEIQHLTQHQASLDVCHGRVEGIIDFSEVDIDLEYRDQSATSTQTKPGIFRYVLGWMNSYSYRWNHHRESVTSTSSFVTLLSNKSKSISSSEI